MQLGITTIQRDRALWIKEWVAFHYLVGFRKFYIFPHECSDNTEEVLEGLKKKFDITIFHLDSKLELLQLKCYEYSLAHYLQSVDWMAFIDGDEFLFPTSADSMREALAEFADKELSALGVYWSCFGSSNYIEEPKGLITENYKYRASDGYVNNQHVKSIVKGKKAASQVHLGGNAHVFRTLLGTFDENLRPVKVGFEPHNPTYNKLCINHYVTQSRSFFLSDKRKNQAIFKKGSLSESWWEEHNRNDVYDHSMDKYIKPLKELLSTV